MAASQATSGVDYGTYQKNTGSIWMWLAVAAVAVVALIYLLKK